MKVEFTREGGLAYFPTLNKPVTLDTDSFSPEDVREFQRLLDEASFFDLPNRPGGSTSHGTASHGTASHGTASHGTASHGTASHGTTGRGADRYQYTIHVDQGGRDNTVCLTEPVEDPRHKALLDFLSTKVQGMTKDK